MSPSGSLFDSDKLNDVSKNTISRMSAQQVYDGVVGWAEEFDSEFCALLKNVPAYAQEILNIGRGGKKPRKDLTFWNEAKDYMSFFYDALCSPDYSGLSALKQEDAIKILSDYKFLYNESDDQQSWFDKIRALSEKYGYAPDTKLYKETPQSFKGHVGDVSSLIRVALTGRTSSPDMFEVMRILGTAKVHSRIDRALTQLKQTKQE
jgi:glutamyl-tRNA synthetase